MGQSRLNEAKDTNYFTLPTGEATLPKAPETTRTHDAGKLPLSHWATPSQTAPPNTLLLSYVPRMELEQDTGITSISFLQTGYRDSNL